MLDLTTVTIKTNRLRLVPVDFKYEEEIFREFNSEVTRYMYPRPATNIEETRSFIRTSQENLLKGTELVTAILIGETGEFIGCAGLHKIGTESPELGIWTKKSSHGSGYGREAIGGLIIWARENIQFDHLIYPVDKRNVPSRRIPESYGGVIKGEFKKVNQSGFELDEVVYWIYR